MPSPDSILWGFPKKEKPSQKIEGLNHEAHLHSRTSPSISECMAEDKEVILMGLRQDWEAKGQGVISG